MLSHLSQSRLKAAGATTLFLLLLLIAPRPAFAQTVIPAPTPEATKTEWPPIPPSPTPRPWPYLHRAGVVVRYSSGDVVTRCVHFSEDMIGGDELLERSGLMPTISADGMVCAISGDGCPVDDCLCRCPFPECEYWAYYHLIGTAWRYSEVGPGGWVTQDGNVDGWSWGAGDFSQGLPLPVITFGQICPPADLTPQPTATTHYTPLPSYTCTPTATPAVAPTPPAEIPEPATLLLLAPGLAALAAWGIAARRRKP